ncbi:MAG: S1C family serine protease [Methanomicrobiales archaeon]
MSSQPTRRMWTMIAAMGVIVAAALAAGFVLGGLYAGNGAPAGDDGDIQARLDLLTEALQENDETWPVDDIYRSVKPAVVKITVVRERTSFYGTYTENSQGSGFVYRDDGLILTNHHVTEGAERILVTFQGGETREAELVGSDPYTDLSVLRVDGLPEGVRPVRMGDSADLEPGDRVIAIGTPFGLSRTMTTGIVSQTGRLLYTQTNYAIPAVIQIDAAINPGSSGGPLLDFAGEVVGMTTAIRSETGEFSGIGFAVPADLIERAAEGIIATGSYGHPWLGITGSDVTIGLAQKKDVTVDHGWYVQSVSPGGPAEDAGIREGDVVVKIDGTPVFGLEEILSTIELSASPGDTVTLTISRNGMTMDKEVTLGVRPAP